MNELGRKLERIEIPDEHGARERTWPVVRSAFAERPARPRGPLHLRPAVALALVLLAAVVAAALTSPGMAVLDRIRKTVGVEHAAPALFALPTQGRLLVRTDAGVWVVRRDGSKRLVGPYREASWSPFGRFVVAARANELVTLEPDGHVHWTLARPGARLPSWGGSRTDTRIAYLGRGSLRVVAGDGTGDRLGCATTRVAAVAPAWQPGSPRILAVATRDGAVRVYESDDCRLLWRTTPGAVPRKIEWSSDGKRLLVLSRRGLRVYDARGRIVAREDTPGGARYVDTTFLAGGHAVVAIRVHGAQSDVFELHPGRSLFHVAGVLDRLAASPDGRWLLVTWPSAEQWVFVRADGRGLRAVSNISRQFDSGSFPRIEGWAP